MRPPLCAQPSLTSTLTAPATPSEHLRVQCSNAAHIAVAADVERHKEVIKRLQTEHRAVGDVRKTLMEWMPSLESIR